MSVPARRTARGGAKLKAPKRPGLDLSGDEMLKRLNLAISQIQNHNISTLSYEEHYRYAYNLVLYDQGDSLYSAVRKQIASHLERQCSEDVGPTFPAGASVASLPEHIRALSKAGRDSSKGKASARASSSTTRTTASIDGPSAGSASITLSTAGGAGTKGDKTDAAALAQAGERFLRAVRDVWDDHEACIRKLKDVLKYVDRVYVAKAQVPEIYDLGLELFRDTVLFATTHEIRLHLYHTLLIQIQLEREGSVINRSALKSNIDMLSALAMDQRYLGSSKPRTVYQAEFEPVLLAVSTEFYRAEATRLLDSRDAGAYLKYVDRRLKEETERVGLYLNNATEAPLREILKKELLTHHLQTIVDMSGSGLVAMLDQGRDDDLMRMYALFKRVPEGLPTLNKGIRSYIASRGKAINEQVSNKTSPPASTAATSGSTNTDAPSIDGEGQVEPSAAGKAPKSRAAAPANDANAASTPQAALALKWVEDVLAFKTRFDQVLRDCFLDGKTADAGCETAINEAFESFINSNARAPEFISLFIDENLKKGLKGKTEEEVDVVLNRTILVFRFLHEKDVFERYYKSHLAKRMLQGRSVSDDAERGMMAKLKIECGHGYVQKLQGMLNDMKVSEDTMSAFNESVHRTGREMPFELSINVLTSTYWPISAAAQPCTMAATMVEAREIFTRFYQSRHSGRILTWHPNLGNADVRVQFKSRKHELNVSTYALVVLLLFQDVAEDHAISYQEIAGSTGIPDSELQRTLQSLACAKYKILMKEPKSREISISDKFVFNVGFSCNLARIKINQVAARVESAAERKETTEKVEEERKNQVEACIVRVMKDRKTMPHNELVTEVIRQLSSRFQPSPALLKRRIESLIDREYLERAENAMNVYNYLA
ncbi:Cullin-domain-containing protein [Ceraceosorus guamensis]|uniref:Cullin-domain-containing protein n=1 Tax=Ceraceosorus guamensis TaxID=1522189 RepID=A0A316W3A3_9BASI|nr:Cullin-domain-containing protein [Ceraceosorus guamensis]PWN43253.1 Cullin-domain-containing protein [Ceraceosorus guamensis]